MEFLPEENGENYGYLYQVKQLAKEAGLQYYAKVAWKKDSFVANTGRKSKNGRDRFLYERKSQKYAARCKKR